MKLFEKIKRFIRGAGKGESDAVLERSDMAAGILESFTKGKGPKETKRAFDRSWIPEP